ncbi:MAG: dihydroorotate dehydrogenase electron transfer subunit [Armatimonadetes bacterium]|nr:dihydroorotate dehydrogenase electron transfer subunit [Candidatus Hippobium faecium]
MRYVENALILSNMQILDNCFRMRLSAPKICQNAVPGQFIEISCSDTYDPILKRPISIHNVTDDVLEIIYYRVGRGTDLLSGKQPGEYAEIVGPLGKGFDTDFSGKHILVGGGYGVPPMYFLAKELMKKNDPKDIFVCIGAKNSSLILCEKDFIDLGINLFIATDDGSAGRKGFVTEAVRSVLDNCGGSFRVYSCGPSVMMKNLVNLTEKYDNTEDTFCSMEHIMACGVGVCNGCVIKVKDGENIVYKRVCKDGPVFRGTEIVW